jgi:uncharacterized hydrophobic protein (TIGR00271 family)
MGRLRSHERTRGKISAHNSRHTRRSEEPTMSQFPAIIRDNLFEPEDVPKFEAKLFFEGAKRRQQYEQFGVLLFLATVIATAGVISDSTATVIGAMIIAPLMTPIMATTAALTMGQVRRAGRALLLVVIGVLGVISLSALLGWLYTGIIDFNTNPQILGRASPRVIDLIAALASGAAGAFCMSREDISDSLAGVAIAISLVPPLCVVGLSLQAGQWAAAQGALLLFITNFLAILLAGGAVLAVLGLSRAANVHVTGPYRRTAYLAIGVATVLVAVPLAITGRQVTADYLAQQQSKAVVAAWVAGSGYAGDGVVYQPGAVKVSISGTGEPPAFDKLVTDLRAKLRQPVVVTLRIVPAQEVSSQ